MAVSLDPGPRAGVRFVVRTGLLNNKEQKMVYLGFVLSLAAFGLVVSIIKDRR